MVHQLVKRLLKVVSQAPSAAAAASAARGKTDALTTFYNARPATIYGGSNEVQRNIVAQTVLG